MRLTFAFEGGADIFLGHLGQSGGPFPVVAFEQIGIDLPHRGARLLQRQFGPPGTELLRRFGSLLERG